MDIYDEADKVRLKMKNTEFQNLDEKERVLLSIVELETEVNNGGFNQFYFNSSGNYANMVPDYLRRVNALNAASIVHRANEVFGESVPAARSMRQDLLSKLTDDDQEPWEELDAEFFSYPDDIAQLLEDFLLT